MSKQEKIISGLDGKPVHLTTWLPETAPVAVLQLVHGFGEFAGRYAEWAERFTARGFAVYLLDQRGHGRTPGRRGAVADYTLFLDDVQAVRNLIADELPDLPVALYGHSMGGNVSLNFLLRRQPERYTCAVISCPWLRLYNPPAPAMLKTVGVLARVMPKFTIHTGLDTGILSHDREHVDFTMSEKLYHSALGARVLLQTIENGEYAIAHAGELKLPALLMQAGDDRLVSPDAAREFSDNAGDNVVFKTYPNLYHELHNERERADIFNTVLEFIAQHIPALVK